ncbi:ChaC-like protein [Roseibacterium elongatum DSM 19469]|uniref:glutathione-specific gamma-glutamylcyclotransferase n=1 Tax=Roseicyclus elongatus DSM 19469 TaxID=1294273 RepID=W8S225_9RHOB|nr:gamma-glutamylcyclotransferase [Roseibacterium elongatum]AHM02796.1 ChaC-like protein [Roseibacterium elongatum DSM 19469]
MPQHADPFAHHPELRDKITDPEASFFRDFSVARIMAQFPRMAAHRDWPYSDSAREGLRRAALDGHAGDLWVFGYGSLMWDPALRFSDLRRARVDGFARRMILVDWRGGRGTEDAPGLMAALDHGEACEGLAFRVPAERVEVETQILFRREIIAPGYIARFVPARLADRTVQALTFLADHAIDDIRGDLTRADQIEMIATGAGFLGSSRDYLANIVDHFDTLGIHDEDCVSLLRDVDARLAAPARTAQTAKDGQ